MIAIRAVRVSRLVTESQIFDGERYIGILKRSSLTKAHFKLDGVDFNIERNPRAAGLVLLRGRQPVAKAKRPGVFARFTVDAIGGPYLLKKQRWYRKTFVLIRGPKEVGRIEPDGRFGRDALGALPSELPAAEQVFLLHLALVTWGTQGKGAA